VVGHPINTQGSTESAMSGSDSKNTQEGEASSPNETGRPSLADFLAPPRSRGSVPAPAEASTAPAVPADRESPPTVTKIDAAWQDARSDVTPTEPTAGSDTPSMPASPAAIAAARQSVAPSSNSDASARSLIPVATGSSDAPSEELDDEFELPGARAPWSSAAVRRATFVALLAAAAAVPAWVVLRARSIDVQAHTDSPAGKSAAGAATPSTLEPAREMEADDDKDDPAPAAPAPLVAIDPVKGLQMRQEARRLLESGQIDPGVLAARRAIELNPNDPECYVLLAAGLQDQGRWAESREVFSRCVRKSSTGINAECAYFANSGTITNR
jgi:hypothetical protein